MINKIHECKYFKGKMINVATRNYNKEIYCRGCGNMLREEMVEKNMLKRIKRERKHDKI